MDLIEEVKEEIKKLEALIEHKHPEPTAPVVPEVAT